MRKSFVIGIASVATAVFFAGCVQAAPSGATYEKLRIRVSTSGTALGVDSLAATKFSELVKEASGGNIRVDVFPSCQLSGGSMPKNVALLAQGKQYEMAVLSATVLGNLDEKYLVVGIPFTFSSYADVNARLDGTGGKWLAKMLQEKGITYLSGMHY